MRFIKAVSLKLPLFISMIGLSVTSFLYADSTLVEPKAPPNFCAAMIGGLVPSVAGFENPLELKEPKPLPLALDIRLAKKVLPSLFEPATSLEAAKLLQRIFVFSKAHDSIEALEVHNAVLEMAASYEQHIQNLKFKGPVEKGKALAALQILRDIAKDAEPYKKAHELYQLLQSTYSSDSPQSKEKFEILYASFAQEFSALDHSASISKATDKIIQMASDETLSLAFRLRLLEVTQNQIAALRDKQAPLQSSEMSDRIQKAAMFIDAAQTSIVRKRFESFENSAELEVDQFGEFTMIFSMRVDSLRNQMLDAPGSSPELLARKIISVTDAARRLGMESSGIIFELNKIIEETELYSEIASDPDRQTSLQNAAQVMKIERDRIAGMLSGEKQVGKMKERTAALELILKPRPQLAGLKPDFRKLSQKVQENFEKETHSLNFEQAEALFLALRDVALRNNPGKQSSFAVKQIFEHSISVESIENEIAFLLRGLASEDAELSQQTQKVAAMTLAWLKAEKETGQENNSARLEAISVLKAYEWRVSNLHR